MPSPVRAEHRAASAFHPGVADCKKSRAACCSRRACSARSRLSPSALLMRMSSAISMMPFLMPCSSSPAPGSKQQQKKIHHGAQGNFALADPHAFHQDHVEAAPLRIGACLARAAGHAAEAIPAGDGRMKAAVRGRDVPCASCPRECCRRNACWWDRWSRPPP